ncbi:hypothetical protein BDR07DRAFT_1393124 [Suillus spraguei]|nr:hypothetical protein BDR07DRAFT_1393124 [Suillus spraguei]
MAVAPSASAKKQQRRDHARLRAGHGHEITHTESGTWPWHHQPSAKKQQRRDHAQLRAGHGRGTISVR